MAFTALNVGDQISPNLDQILIELKTALNERQASLRITQTGGWSTSEEIITRAGSYITILRTAITDLIVPHAVSVDYGVFVSPTTHTLFADDDDLLDYAGYPGGWIDTAGLPVSDASIWAQFQDVFSSLKKLGLRPGGFGGSQFFDYRSAYNASNEVAWDNAVADSPSGITVGVPMQWLVRRVHVDNKYEWLIYGPTKESEYDTAGWDQLLLGAFDRERRLYTIYGEGTGSAQITFSIDGCSSTFVAKEDGTNNAVDAVAYITSGFTFGANYVVTNRIDTAEPASAPMITAIGSEAKLTFALGEFRIIFDVSSTLSYG